MVVEYIRYTIDSERAQVFEQAYRRAAVALDASSSACAMRSRAAATTLPITSFASTGTRKRDTCQALPEPRVPQLLRGGRPVRARHR